MKPEINRITHSFCRVYLCLIVTVLLSACIHSGSQAPIRDRQQPPSQKISQHVVAPGETLFSIAWRYGLDYKRLAQINGIDSSFTIHPGEVINLRADRNYESYQKKQPYKSSSKPSASSAATAPVYKAAKVVTKNTQRAAKSTINAARKKSASIVKSIPSSKKSNITWRWPLKGAVIGKFSGAQGLNKGIDIKAKKGDKVSAAAGGTVVYAGSGLRGYGKLVIIKHSDMFLSAYGHNSRLQVKEGSVVSAGQHIANAGSSGTDTTKLHFEIRRDGKPVNPLSYLPK